MSENNVKQINSANAIRNKKLITIFIAGLVIFGSFFLPANAYLSQQGIRTIAVMLSFLIILIFEAMPTVVLSMLYCALLPLLGLTNNVADAFSGFTQPLVFFALLSFAVALAITKVPLANRFLRLLLVKFGKNVKMILLALMICCAGMSSFVSNVPTCVVFTSIALSFIDLCENEETKKSLGKVFMIAVAVSCQIGGMATPAGSSINLMGIAQLEKLTGLTISFVQWTCIALPFTVVLLFIAWWVIVKVYKPVEISKEEIQSFVDSIKIPDKFLTKEIKVLVIVLAMFTLWIMSSWITSINVIIVTIIGGTLFFMPGIEVLDAKTFLKETGWDSFFIIGVMFSISNLFIQHGVTNALTMLIPEMHVNIVVLVGFVALLTLTLLIIMPVAPSLIPILAITLVSVAASANVSPTILVMTATLCACNCYLLPLDIIPLMTYSKGYYKISDLPKSTVIIQLFIVLLLSLWMPLVGSLFGMI